jgi:hypothetical protein
LFQSYSLEGRCQEYLNCFGKRRPDIEEQLKIAEDVTGFLTALETEDQILRNN